MSQTTPQLSAEERALVELCVAGDERAFAILYRRWHPRWARFAHWLVGNRDDSGDVMQEAALAIARNIHRLKDVNQFKAWSFTIIRRRAADHIRGAVRLREIREALTLAQQSPEVTPAADTTLESLFAALGAEDKRLLILFYEYGFTVAEIGRVLAVPAGTVKSRLFNARKRLREAADIELTGEPT
ncbi:MAG: RNA polymerase sigma factor [Pseudomonadota bacterium]